MATCRAINESKFKTFNVQWNLGTNHAYIYIAMMTSSNGNIFRVTGYLCGNSPVSGEFPTQRPVTRSFDVFFDLRLNKWLSKQSWGWWFETLSLPSWRHCNGQWCGKSLHAITPSWFIGLYMRLASIYNPEDDDKMKQRPLDTDWRHCLRTRCWKTVHKVTLFWLEMYSIRKNTYQVSQLSCLWSYAVVLHDK